MIFMITSNIKKIGVYETALQFLDNFYLLRLITKFAHSMCLLNFYTGTQILS